jgi:hypothetical protein
MSQAFARGLAIVTAAGCLVAVVVASVPLWRSYKDSPPVKTRWWLVALAIGLCHAFRLLDTFADR